MKLRKGKKTLITNTECHYTGPQIHKVVICIDLVM